MLAKIQMKRGTTAQWALNDPILADGEPGLDTDLEVMKVGNGVDAWTTLPLLAENVAVDALVAQDADAGSDFRVQQDARHLNLQPGRYVRPSGDTTGVSDRVAIQNAIDNHGGARLGRGDYYTDLCIQMKSHTFVVGLGKGITRITNVKETQWNNATPPKEVANASAIVFLCGNFHPAYLQPDVGGINTGVPRWNHDTLTPFSDDASVVVRTTNTFPLVVGQLVFIKTNAPAASPGEFVVGHIRRVTAISGDGNTITLHKSIDGVAGHTIAHISDGNGATHPAVPAGGTQIQLPSYLVEKTLLQGFSVTTNGQWTARFGVLEGTFRDIDSINTHALIFGNAAQDCHFENISGNFRARFIETVDGARDNTYFNIRGVQTGGFDYEIDEPVMKLGRNSVLSDFNVRVKDGHQGNWVQFFAFNGTTVRNGFISGDSTSISQAIHFANEPNNTFENVTLAIKGVLNGNLIVLSEACDQTTVRNIRVINPAGKAASTYTVRVAGNEAPVTRSIVDNVMDSTGTDEYLQNSSVGCKMTNLSWRPTTSGRTVAGANVNAVATDQERTVILTGAAAQTYTIDLVTSYFGIGTRTWLYKNSATGTITVAGANGSVIVVDPTLTLPAAAYSRLVVEKIDATTFYVRRG